MSDSSTRDDHYRRALGHLETQIRLRAGTVVEGPPGVFAVFDDAWPVSHVSNRVLVTAALPETYGADEVLVFVDQAFAGRGLSHRKVDVLDDRTAGRITPALQGLGFSHDEVLVMTAAPILLPADDPARSVAQVVDESVVRPLVERGWQVAGADYGPEVVRQLVERRDANVRVGGATVPLVVLDPASGEAVAKADLLLLDELGEIDDVLTLPDHRNQGYASALVRRALDLAQETDFVYLQAAEDDWPKELYARLGFVTVGSVHEHSLLDLPPDDATDAPASAARPADG